MTEPAVPPEPADSPTTDVVVEGPSELVRELREKFPEPPRAGSLKKLAPGQGLALIGIVCCAWTPFILWWAFGPAALVLVDPVELGGVVHDRPLPRGARDGQYTPLLRRATGRREAIRPDRAPAARSGRSRRS